MKKISLTILFLFFVPFVTFGATIRTQLSGDTNLEINPATSSTLFHTFDRAGDSPWITETDFTPTNIFYKFTSRSATLDGKWARLKMRYYDDVGGLDYFYSDCVELPDYNDPVGIYQFIFDDTAPELKYSDGDYLMENYMVASTTEALCLQDTTSIIYVNDLMRVYGDKTNPDSETQYMNYPVYDQYDPYYALYGDVEYYPATQEFSDVMGVQLASPLSFSFDDFDYNIFTYFNTSVMLAPSTTYDFVFNFWPYPLPDDGAKWWEELLFDPTDPDATSVATIKLYEADNTNYDCLSGTATTTVMYGDNGTLIGTINVLSQDSDYFACTPYGTEADKGWQTPCTTFEDPYSITTPQAGKCTDYAVKYEWDDNRQSWQHFTVMGNNATTTYKVSDLDVNFFTATSSLDAILGKVDCTGWFKTGMCYLFIPNKADWGNLWTNLNYEVQNTFESRFPLHYIEYVWTSLASIVSNEDESGCFDGIELSYGDNASSTSEQVCLNDFGLTDEQKSANDVYLWVFYFFVLLFQIKGISKIFN